MMWVGTIKAFTSVWCRILGGVCRRLESWNWEVIINDEVSRDLLMKRLLIFSFILKFHCTLDTMPEMIYRFIEQNVRSGPHISLKCSARGSPPPQVKYSFVAVKILPSINFRFALTFSFPSVYVVIRLSTHFRRYFLASLCNGSIRWFIRWCH